MTNPRDVQDALAYRRRSARRLHAALLTGVSALIAPLTVVAAAAQAATQVTYQVTTTADSHDLHPGDGHCADAAGQCSLRAAVEEADAAPAGTTVGIGVPAGGYNLTLGTLSIGSSSVSPLTITITGADPTTTLIDAHNSFRVISVTASATVTIEGVGVTGGRAGPSAYGGGIDNAGNLTLFDTEISGNSAAAGGGVDNEGGSLVITGSLISANNGGFFGGGGVQNGGIKNLPGAVLIVSSTITNNRTSNEGGGVFSGQNGHPASADGPGVAPVPLCPGAPRCDRARLPLFSAPPGQTLRIVDSAITNNKGGNGGGGVAANGGTATVSGSQIDGNSAGSAVGGGLFGVGDVRHSSISGNSAASGGAMEVFPSGSVTITTSTINDNHAQAYGAGIDLSGRVTVSRSTFADNGAGGRFLGGGAAIQINGGGLLTLTDSTLTGNRTVPPGGAALGSFDGSATLAYDTFSGNSGAIGAGFTMVTATIIAGDGSSVPNCSTPLHEGAGFNLDSGSSCGLSLATDITQANPRLGPLMDNGGPTLTRALLSGSPAIDHGGTPTSAGCPLTDQRGFSRPWGPACDIGAFEKHYPFAT